VSFARHLRGLCFANDSDMLSMGQLFQALFCGNKVDVADLDFPSMHMKQYSLVSENRQALQFPFNI
jgi:hypothetical protein